MTPGTFAALKRQWRYAQDRFNIPWAWIRADIHNAWMHEKGRPPKTALDFLPGKKSARQSWQNDMAVFAAVAQAKGYERPAPADKEAALARWLEAARQRREELNQAAA